MTDVSSGSGVWDRVRVRSLLKPGTVAQKSGRRASRHFLPIPTLYHSNLEDPKSITETSVNLIRPYQLPSG